MGIQEEKGEFYPLILGEACLFWVNTRKYMNDTLHESLDLPLGGYKK